MLRHTLQTILRRTTLTLAAAILMLSAAPARAADNDINLQFALQSAFADFVGEIGTAMAYNPVGPAETLGIAGFDVGVSVTAVDVDQALWSQAVTDADAPSMVAVPRFQVRKGLPFGVDVGAAYTAIPGGNVSVIGIEARKALITGGIGTPAVSLIGHYSTLTGVDQLDLATYGADLAVSKGFAMLTPYAGVGRVWIDAAANVPGLNDASKSVYRGYTGVKMTVMPVMNLVVQADFSVVNSYTLRANIGF